jgi:hypothetical protein
MSGIKKSIWKKTFSENQLFLANISAAECRNRNKMMKRQSKVRWWRTKKNFSEKNTLLWFSIEKECWFDFKVYFFLKSVLFNFEGLKSAKWKWAPLLDYQNAVFIFKLLFPRLFFHKFWLRFHGAINCETF